MVKLRLSHSRLLNLLAPFPEVTAVSTGRCNTI
jgi:hypothetical protein